MAHIAADRVKETTATIGTIPLVLAGAATGFRAFSAVMAANDTCFYCIVGGAEWEVGFGTFSAGTLTRTTVIDGSSGLGVAVNLSVGMKDVFITVPAQVTGTGLLTTTPSADQDNYAPTGLAYCNRLGINASASISISGLAGGLEAREMTISNRSTDFLLILENENTASTAANRFSLSNGFPMFLMPGDRIRLAYSSATSRWQTIAAGSNIGQMGLTVFEDFTTTGTPANNGSAGQMAVTFTGTGASAQQSAYLVDATEKPVGVIQVDTGSTATGRAGVGSTGADQIVPGQGPALAVSRVAIEATVSAAETFQAVCGFVDVLAAGALTDGAYWNNRWTGAAAEWSQDRASNTTVTRSATGSPTPDNNYIWLAVFLNAAWTRADFFYSTDSMNWVKADSPTTGLPAATRPTAFCAGAIVKSVGVTQRNMSIDLAGYRVDMVRG